MDSVRDPDDLPGLDPKDLVPSSRLGDLTDEEREAVQSLVSDEEDIELLDSEIMASVRILEHLNDKYAQRPAVYSTLISMKNEAEYLFEKIGLRALVDWSPTLIHEPPVITIVSRITEFDPHKKAWEVHKGVADEYYAKRG